MSDLPYHSRQDFFVELDTFKKAMNGYRVFVSNNNEKSLCVEDTVHLVLCDSSGDCTGSVLRCFVERVYTATEEGGYKDCVYSVTMNL